MTVQQESCAPIAKLDALVHRTEVVVVIVPADDKLDACILERLKRAGVGLRAADQLLASAADRLCVPGRHELRLSHARRQPLMSCEGCRADCRHRPQCIC